MSGSITFDRDIEFEYGEAQQVTPLLRRVVANNPSAFTFRGTGTYIIGHGHVAVVDPGPDDRQHLDALLAELDGETVTHIFVTHTHRDHSPLAAGLKDATGAQIYAYGPHGSGRESLARASGDVQLDASGDTGFVPDVALEHGDIVPGKGWTLEAVFTPGHMANHMSFALREEHALLCGDHVMAWSTSVIAPPDGNMKDYMASLQLVMEREDNVYWPTHGPQVKRPRQFVRAYIGHRRMREAAIVQQLQAGVRSIPAIVQKLYADISPTLWPAAGMSVLAHMEHLIELEKAETDGAPTLLSDYRIKG